MFQESGLIRFFQILPYGRNKRRWTCTPQRGKRNLAQGKASETSDTLGIRATHIPCALNRRSPAEGKGNGATRRRPKGKAKWQQGTMEVPSGNTFQTFPLAPAGRGPSGYILPRVSFATLILPWARFLLGLAFSDLRFSPYKSYKVSLLSVDYLQAGCR